MICELIDNCPAQIPRGQLCGTDNTTYKDSCSFLCAQLTFDGIKELGVQCGGACPCPKAGSPCSRCNEDYTPICGSDNNTYGNHCMFACGRLANPSIVPSCRNECPCQFSNDADSRSPKAKFLNHLI
ncbi:hypothetical protein RvY_18197-2 [Ramazzottius varieornatus]|uniref:Kazal-like domain-containing protein n=1 Tax=Ramazzottius varieornatus TaxID=947166 RepID=A0A1D1W8A7_RAMVA|nr:hypothetical protein RvY_18197-2 [Ramazzottius varieornatus]